MRILKKDFERNADIVSILNMYNISISMYIKLLLLSGRCKSSIYTTFSPVFGFSELNQRIKNALLQ